MLQNLAFAAAFVLLMAALLTLVGKLAGKSPHAKHYADADEALLFPQVQRAFAELLDCTLPLFEDIPMQRDTRRQRHREAQRLLMIAQKVLQKQEAALPPQLSSKLAELAQLCQRQISAYGEFLQDFSAEKQQEVEQRHQIEALSRAIADKYRDSLAEIRRYQEAYSDS